MVNQGSEGCQGGKVDIRHAARVEAVSRVSIII